MINSSFRNQLEKVVIFIFDNEIEFIKQFIHKKLLKFYIESCKIVEIKLENVFLSNSKVFIRISYHVRILPSDDFSYEHKDFFLDSDEVFDWVNDFVIRKKVN